MNPRIFCSERGYEGFLALTFNLDLGFFETVVLPQLWAGGTGETLIIGDRQAVAETIQRQAAQLRHLGRRYALGKAQVDGRQHAKILLRYGKAGALVWVGSGNLSSGGWGANRELAVAWRVETGDAEGMQDVRRVLETAHHLADGRLRGRIRTALELPALAAADAGGRGRILLSGLDEPLATQLGRRWQGRRFRRARMLTGSTDDRGALLRRLHELFGVEEAIVGLDPASSDFDAERLAGLPLRVMLVLLPRHPVPHAKFLFLDGTDGAAAVVGSANCSAAAWLVPVASGGNVEAVVVYDDVDEEGCGEPLALFAEKAVPPEAAGLPGPRTEKPSVGSIDPLLLEELRLDAQTGQVHARISRVIPGAQSFELEFDGLRTPLHPTGEAQTSFWGPAPDLPNTGGTRFGVVVVRTSTGAVTSSLRWLDEEHELESWRLRRGARALDDLARPAGRKSEYSRIRAEVAEVAAAIFADPGTYPDPAPPRPRREKPTKVEPADPDALLRSIAEVAARSPAHGSGDGVHGFGLSGVLRILFPDPEPPPVPETAEAELEDDEPPGPTVRAAIPTAPPAQPPSISAEEPPAAPPPANEQAKLTKDVENFFQKLSNPTFGNECTSRQLVQAISFPLAVAAKALAGRWIDPPIARAWIQRAVDQLLQVADAGEAPQGLLRRVAERYERDGRAETFAIVVGDGMLWAALCGALLRTAEGAPPDLQRTLTLRDVFEADHLVTTANPGRLAQVLTTAGDGTHLALVERTGEAAVAIRALESALGRGAKALLAAQLGAMTADGDPLWNAQAGFGWARASMRIRTRAKLPACVRRHPKTEKVLADRFVNVRIAAERSQEIRTLLRNAEEASVASSRRPSSIVP